MLSTARTSSKHAHATRQLGREARARGSSNDNGNPKGGLRAVDDDEHAAGVEPDSHDGMEADPSEPSENDLVSNPEVMGMAADGELEEPHDAAEHAGGPTLIDVAQGSAAADVG